jgi:caspase domain-containing protein
MTSPSSFTGAYHALLIGVDAYGQRPLHGAVNDIDAMQRLLLGPKVGLPPASIHRLASPHPGAVHDTSIPEQPATCGNIRAALRTLADKARPEDRVVIHFSGHGARFPVASRNRVLHYEALAPADSEQGNWLFDYELNELLGAITARTRSIVFILDSCYSASVTRSVHNAPPTSGSRPALRARGFTPGEVRVPALPAQQEPAVSSRAGFDVADCHVVAACLDHEEACESIGTDGKIHGVLTNALIETLDQHGEIDPRDVPWTRLWYLLGDRVKRANRMQHIWSSGGLARTVLAGPPVPGDAGLEIRARGSGEYEVGAGTLADVTVNAQIAVYGEHPTKFPPLDSPDDRRYRLPVSLKVISATATTAIARGQEIALPAGVRGRIVRAGNDEALRYAVVPSDSRLAAALSRSGLLALTDEGNADVCVRRAGAQWAITDDVHLGTPDLPALVRLPLDRPDLVRDALEHYTRYRAPLRLANRAIDLPGALEVDLLASPPQDLRGIEATRGDLDTIPMSNHACDVQAGARIAIRVENHAMRPLRVTLVNCAASGKVQLLGDQAIAEYSAHVFWAATTHGVPFVMTPPPGSQRCIDRLVAIGRTALDRSVEFLRIDHGFLERTRNAVMTPPPEQWTATQILIRTSAPGAPALTSAQLPPGSGAAKPA